MNKRLIYICFFNLCTLLLINTTLGDVPVPDASHVLSENISSSDTSEEKTASSDSGTVNDQSENGLNAEVHSSFDEDVSSGNIDKFSSQDNTFSEAASQNSGISTGVADSTPGVVFTLVDSATAELQQKADLSAPSQDEIPSLSPNNLTEKVVDQVVLPKESEISVTLNESNNISEEAVIQQTDKLVLDVPNVEPKTNETDPVSVATTTERSEDIPSFSEWTQKQLEEAEKKKELVNNSAQNQNWNGKQNSSLKVRSKNYASPDCGAKIIAVNPEATNAGAVLSASKDEYYLNVCTNRIWFIVELCEAIQVKKIDIANFELFSSSPKDFTISVSDRFPSREWSNVGEFVAKDEKDIQSFDLSPHLFGKYVKVEVHSHYGSEHFCPISLFRVYGTSEFEVLEKEDAIHSNIEDDDDDETLDSQKGVSPKNLFSSATDAVISIVKKAVEVMGNKGNSTNESIVIDTPKSNVTPLISTCTTVSHYVVCDTCSDVLFGYIYELLSCKAGILSKLISIPFIKSAIYNSEICEMFGLEFRQYSNSTPNINSAYLKAMFPASLLGALCNTVAVIEEKVVLNVSNKFLNTTTNMNLTDIESILKVEPLEPINIEVTKISEDVVPEEIQPTEKLVLDNTDKVSLTPEGITEISYTTEINPTKTLSPEDLNDTNSILMPEIIDSSKVVHATDTVNVPPKVENNNLNEKQLEQEFLETDLINENISEFEATTESSETLEEHLEHIISDLNIDSTTSTTSPTVSRPVQTPGPKESVFLRLSNRIKALERNMSLSSQYLEELSRRYKRQVEEMQRLLDKTISSWAEDKKQREERSQKLEEQITSLTSMVETLVVDKNNWVNTTYWLFIVIIVVTGLLTFCRRAPEKQYFDESTKEVEVKRRKSIDVVRHKTPVKKKRRPSEEALRITGTYQHLMVDDSGVLKKPKEKKRRKKKALIRSNSITTLTEEAADFTDPHRSSSLEVNSLTPKRSTIKLWSRQESAPAKTAWNDSLRNCVEDIPFVLEESENSGLEALPLKPSQPKLEPIKPVASREHTNGNIFLSNLRHFTSSGFMRTARDSRLSRSSSMSLQLNGHQGKLDNGRSPSPDDSIQPESSIASDNLSVNSTSEDRNTPKKEKKSAFKRIFRKVF